MARKPTKAVRMGVLGAVALGAAGLVVSFAGAQDAEKSRFIRFVENQLSTPDRQIRIGAIDGVLSSDVRFASFTIADREGVWLTVEDVELEWSRLALLRGRLDVDRLVAERITVTRAPVGADDGTTDAESGGDFQLPDLPVSVIVDELAIGTVSVAEGLVGPAFAAGFAGRATLDDGALDAALSIERQDRPGTLSIEAAFKDETRQLTVNADIAEPPNGVVANALSIQGRPSVDLRISGDGPLSDFSADIGLATDGADALAGTVRVNDEAGALAFAADLSGDFRPLVAPQFQPLVEGGSSLSLAGSRAAGGSLTLDRFDLQSGAAEVSLSGELASDFVPLNVSLNAVLARADGAPTPLIGVEDGTIGRAVIAGTLGGDLGEAYRVNAELTGLDTPFLVADTATLSASGAAERMGDPATRRVTFDVSGDASGLEQSASAVADAIGNALSLSATGGWAAGEPVSVERADLRTETFATRFAGEIRDGLRGSYQVRADNLTAFSSIAGRDLSGTVSLDAAGFVGFDGLFDLRVDGAAQDLALSTPADGLLAGRLSLDGRAARTAEGVLFDAFRLSGDAITVAANGALNTGQADLRAAIQLADLGAVRDGVSGPVTVQLSAIGPASAPAINAAVESAGLAVGGRSIDDFVLTFDGDWQRAAAELALAGDIALNANVDGEPARLTAALNAAGTRYALRNLDAQVAGAVVRGDLSADGSLLTGELAARVPDLGNLAALALVEASGALNADLTFTAAGGTQNIGAVGEVRDLVVAGARVGFAAFDVTVDDAFGVPLVDGTADVRTAAVAGFDVRDLAIRARREDGASRLTLRGDVAGASVQAEAGVERQQGGFAADIQSLDITKGRDAARLQQPTRVVVRDGAVSLDETLLSLGGGTARLVGQYADAIELVAEFDAVSLGVANLIRPDLQLGGTVDGQVSASGPADSLNGAVNVAIRGLAADALARRGIAPLDASVNGSFAGSRVTLADALVALDGGTIRASGEVGDQLDLNVTARALPLSLANVAAGDLGLSGTIDANAEVTGTRRAPVAVFEVRTQNASAAPLRAAGAGALSADIAGRYARNFATLSRARVTVGGGRIDATGRVGRRLDLDARLTSIPLSLVDAVAPDVALRGALSGDVSVAGTVSSPRVAFRADAGGVSAAPLNAAGLGPVAVSADGTFARNVLRLNRAQVSGAGLSANGSGRIPLRGAGLRIDVDANAPLSLANRFLADRGASVDGAADIDIAVTGSLSSPQVRGRANADGIIFRDPELGLVLREGTAAVELAGDTVILRSVRASLGGGSVSATGRIGLGAGLPADLNVQLNDARYSDGRLVTVTQDGALRITGPITAPNVAGRIDVQRAEITVPETLGGSATLINLRHMGLPVDVDETLRRARVGPYADVGDGGVRGPEATLDITISAPARVFIRGRGIDAELGGEVRIRGPVSAVRPVGRFELIRGRLSILGQRIDFAEGSVTLFGDLNPTIRLVAETRRNDVTVRVVVAGPASEPTVTVESDPTLPQDEALAQLLFGRSIAELSPLQLAQLAAGVAELAGSGGGPGLLDQLRVVGGLDDLQIVTGEDGSPAAQAGTYIADNIYLGVRAGQQSSGVTLNIDITRNLTVRAEALTDRESVGIYYEREY